MAKNKVSEWSATPANNTDVGGIDIAEGCAPSGINNAIRELMAQVKDMQAGTDGDNLTVGGNLSVTGTTALTGNLTASNVSASGTLTVTGITTATAGVIGDIYASNGTSKILENGTDGTDATFTGTATKATNIDGGGAGRIPYNTAAGATSFITAGTAGQILQSNGTSAPSWAASPIGVGQTWQAVTRVASTNYTNNTGKPIMVSIYREGSVGEANLTVGGVIVASSNPDTNAAVSISAIVPDNTVYSFNGGFTYWVELR